MANKTDVRKIIRYGLIRLQRLLHGVDKNTVFFTSFSGKSYSDNPRAVSEALHTLYPDCRIVWGFLSGSQKDRPLVPDYVNVIDVSDRNAFYRAMATCGTWVTNFGFPDIPKSKKQLFIQTWHGDRAFKQILYDSTFIDESYFLPESVDGFCDLAIAGSDYGERQYRTGFRYKGQVLKVGTPRDDILLHPDEERIRRIKESLGLDSSCGLLLYAPTLRRKNQKSHTAQQIQNIDLYRTLSVLEEKTGKEWKCLLRAHPGVGSLAGIKEDEKCMDLSGYEDMTDLLLISDFLITDYSSCAGDFALLNRPIVLYQSDRAEYLEKDRAFYFNMDDAPYYMAQNQEEVEERILSLTEEGVRKNCRDILDFYTTYETGNASEEVAGLIVKHITEKD